MLTSRISGADGKFRASSQKSRLNNSSRCIKPNRWRLNDIPAAMRTKTSPRRMYSQKRGCTFLISPDTAERAAKVFLFVLQRDDKDKQSIRNEWWPEAFPCSIAPKQP